MEDLQPESCENKEAVGFEEISEYFRQYHERKQRESEDVGGIEEIRNDMSPPHPDLASSQKGEWEEHDTPDTDTAADVPLHITLVLQILERCQHLLVSEDVEIQLQVLRTIIPAVSVLSPHETQMLPMVHKLWQPLLTCLTRRTGSRRLRWSGRGVVVLRLAFTTLLTLSRTAGDFLRQRSVSEVLPVVVEFLSGSVGCPEEDRRGSQRYRLELCVLQGVATLCSHVSLTGGMWLERVARACGPYLSGRQPEPLQAAARHAFTTLIRLHPDSMWLLLSDLLPPRRRLTRHHLPPVTLHDHTDTTDNQQYHSNVTKLLQLIH